MTDSKEKPTTWTIEIINSEIRYTPDNVGINKEFTKLLDRKKDGILPPEIVNDMWKIANNLTYEDSNGRRIGKYLLCVINLPANPKSSQKRKMKKQYQEILIDQMKIHEDQLIKFQGKKMLIYMRIYLRESKFDNYDIDNFQKAIFDALKVYVGDDSNIESFIAEKVKLTGYSESDLDFIEQSIIAVTTPDAKTDILK
ncbi:MAG: hypothetical protein KAS16_04450 [Thermoplasmata archaeon]|nr:hypothetical protein [Thermoplasmata archaeon]